MRRAEIRTELEAADAVAAALRPDNTDEMDTHVEDGTIVTTIERETTGGLRSTVDDYVVNVDVAARTLARSADRSADGNEHDRTTMQDDTTRQ